MNRQAEVMVNDECGKPQPDDPTMQTGWRPKAKDERQREDSAMMKTLGIHAEDPNCKTHSLEGFSSLFVG